MSGLADKKDAAKPPADDSTITSALAAASLTTAEASSKHRFWSTQPVSKYTGGGGGEAVATNSPIPSGARSYAGPLRHQTVESTKQEPYALPAGFEWSCLDLSSTETGDLEEVYNLLARNYVEDDDAMFRFDYKREFLTWAVTAPGHTSDLHLGVRVEKTGKLMGLITAIPQDMKVHGVSAKCVEINFLCVHKKLRSKRLAPVLIKEITRRVNLKGIFQAVYTAGVQIPGSVGSARYYHRSLNPKKLIECNFTRLNPRLTMALTVKLYKTLKEPKTYGLRAMREEDVVGAHELLMGYLQKFKVYPDLTVEEFRHWLIPRAGVVNSYVSADASGKIINLCSFYHLPSTVINNPKHDHLYAAYSYYNVCAEGTTLTELMDDCLCLAKKDEIDVFNCLDVMENKEFLQPLKFGAGDGNLRYYLYNMACPEVSSDEIGLVLL